MLKVFSIIVGNLLCFRMIFPFFPTDKLVVSTSCSLLHTAVDIVNETKLDEEIKSWLAFAAQKVVEVNALAKALVGDKDEVLNGILHTPPSLNASFSFCFTHSSISLSFVGVFFVFILVRL